MAQEQSLTYAQCLAQRKQYLTYEQCLVLLPPKSKRKHRTLTQCSRLYRHENGQSFMVKLTSWRAVAGGAKEVYDPPIAVIHPHNVAVLSMPKSTPVGVITIGNIFFKLFGLGCRSKTDRSSSVRFWCRNRRPPYTSDTKEFPFSDGLQLDITNCAPVAGVPEVLRRRVDLEKTKPVRDQIAAWDKLARTFFQMLDTWSETYAERFRQLRRTGACFPSLGVEPSTDGLLQIMAASNVWYTWRMDNAGTSTRHFQQIWKSSFERWKDALYAEHGVYSWQPVVKAA